MKRLNTTLDREPMTSQEIRERQDFNYILKEANAAKVPIWKSIWFYGPVGIAMVTMVVSAVRMNPKNQQFDDNNITLSQFNTTNTEDISADTFVVEKSEELTETKSEPNKENDVPVTTNVEMVNPSNTITPNVKADPLTESALPVNDDQEEPPILINAPVEMEVEAKPVMTLANIAGVTNGRVVLSQICSEGIGCNNGYRVVSYDIQYDDGRGGTVDRVSGSTIPEYICRNLKRYNMGSPVFITRIVAENDKGERKQLLSMNIEPTF
ncbi:MAG: hypothetical protein AB8B56_06575 [Crocinitomicaceae bacterium]